MGDVGNFLDGGRLLKTSPLHSWHFRVVSTVALSAVVIDVYLLYRHWALLNSYAALALGIPIGVQLIYQWWRAVRYYSKIREVYAEASNGETTIDSPRDIALRIAVGAMIDILFYSYGMLLVSLILIGTLLTRIDGVK